MNKQLREFAKEQLKRGLIQLPESNIHKFKQMYSYRNIDADIADVVEAMDDDKLDWAMIQVQNSLDKLSNKEKHP